MKKAKVVKKKADDVRASATKALGLADGYLLRQIKRRQAVVMVVYDPETTVVSVNTNLDDCSLVDKMLTSAVDAISQGSS